MSRPGDVDGERLFQPPEEPALDLELADVPRRLPRGPVSAEVAGQSGRVDAVAGAGAAPVGAVGDAGHAPAPTLAPAVGAPTGASTGASAAHPGEPGLPAWAGGGTTVEESPWDDPTTRTLAKVLAALAVLGLLYGGYRLYRWATRPDIYTVRSPYRGSTGITIDLPAGGGWKTDRTARVKEKFGPAWVRGEIVFRGASVHSATEMLLVVRAHGPGGFSRIDRAQLRRGLEQSLTQQMSSLGGSARGLSCVPEDTWRAEPGEACYGRLVMADREIGAGAFLWIAGDSDLIGIIYVTEEASLDALEQVSRSAR